MKKMIIVSFQEIKKYKTIVLFKKNKDLIKY